MCDFINNNPSMESYSAAYVNDVEHIVTEYDMVNLRGKSTRERALALISIARTVRNGPSTRNR
jgi:Acetyl-CoA hydrolase/transferase C-terminal domain